MRKYLGATIGYISGQLGLSPNRMLRGLAGLPRYFMDYRKFTAKSKESIWPMPCVQDWHDAAGAVSSEYFGQDLYVAQKIFAARPNRHVDVGSRIDGFVAHVASFRLVEVIDIRPVSTNIRNVTFRQADFVSQAFQFEGYCDSLSCLHALEHFGLGRYGDVVDPEGFLKGFQNLARMVIPGGVLYLSVPLGKQRVMFNAHRISDPIMIKTIAQENELQIEAFAYWNGSEMIEALDIASELTRISTMNYVLGVFVLRRNP